MALTRYYEKLLINAVNFIIDVNPTILIPDEGSEKGRKWLEKKKEEKNKQ